MLRNIEKAARLAIYLYHKLSVRLRYPRLAALGAHSLVESPVTIIDAQNVVVGSYVVIKKWTWIYAPERKKGARIVIGDHCEINPFCIIAGGDEITFGRYVLLSPHVVILSSSNYYAGGKIIALNPLELAPVRIADNVHIGTGAVILPGVTIGEGSVIGANAVVTGDIPPGAIAVGTPARVIKFREGYEIQGLAPGVTPKEEQ